MKTRNDFVSNSSSSSFIVISETEDETEEIKKRFSEYTKSYPYVFPNAEYKTEFGWEFENTCDFGGKLNFVGLQLLYVYMTGLEGKSAYDFDGLYGMVQKVCREQFGFEVELDTSLVKKRVYKNEDGTEETWYNLESMNYIDHQSCVTENECMEMFESEKSMIDFLANGDSYIKGGNDNSDD